jgi:uncharacterized protein
MRPANDHAASALSESETIDFLAQGDSYGLPGRPVERIETHCSIVFLIDQLAYKLKRPIAFSSLDYTSLERREAACRREVELNRRTAPDLYLGVRAIRRDRDGALTFDGTGPVVDWVVAMRRFEQSDLFDRLAEENRLSPDLARQLAEEIARFHAGAEMIKTSGGADGLRQAIERNRHDQSTAASILRKEAVESLYAGCVAALESLAPILDRRRASGCVRICHGDLRLANICLYHGRPTLFDAIEFANELACIDVLYDLAFLLMDLELAGMHIQANIVFNSYLDATTAADGLIALPLMMSIRAGTRAYAVAGSSLRRADPEQSRRLAAVAQDLMRLAFALLEPGSPYLVAIGGGTDVDLSAMAAALAPAFRPAPGARIARTIDATAAPLSNRTDAIVSAGYTEIIARPFDTSAERQHVAELAAAHRVPFLGLWLGAPRDAPPTWHVIDPACGTAAATDALHRFVGATALWRGRGDP